MREEYWKELYNQMKENTNIWCLVGDLGYGGADKIKQDFPERFLNCGASEQAMIGIAVGLSLKGKIPFCYSITNFLIYRPFEWLRNYLHHEQINVKLAASGRDFDYATEGWTHHSPDAKAVLDTIPGIVQHWPQEVEEIPNMVREMVKSNKPEFISLKR